jgi:hypothetical protein
MCVFMVPRVVSAPVSRRPTPLFYMSLLLTLILRG